MATLAWKSNVGGPSDEELNRVVQAHEEGQRSDEEQRREEVKRLVADPEVYDHRLAERGYREYTFWGKGRYRGRRLTNITKAHTASAAVNEGSIKTRDRDLAEIRAKVEHLDGLQKATEAWNSGAFAERVREAFTDWQALLTQSPEVARQIIRKLLMTPIFCFPDTAQDGTKRWVFSATGTYGRSLLGVIDSSGADSELATMKWANVPRPAEEIRAELRQLATIPSLRQPLPDGH